MRFALLLSPALLAAPAIACAQDTPRASIEVTQRTRYETLHDQFRPQLDERDRVLALQTSVVVRGGGERLQFLGEILDSRAEWNDGGSFVSTSIVNTLEPIQAYMAWQAPNVFREGATSTVRVGRMTLDLGKRRVVARNRYRNTVASFVGADWHWRSPEGGVARAFYFVPMRFMPPSGEALLDNDQQLDRAQRGAALWGGYYALPTLQNGSVLELYGLDYRVSARGSDPLEALHLTTVGARAYRSPARGRWSYEVEVVLQSGESPAVVQGTARTGLDHDADFVHLELGYQLDTRWAPRIALQYDRASGDENPSDDSIERFNTLFGARRFDFHPTGIYGPFARSNIETPGVRVAFEPTPRLEAMFALRSFRLAEPRDAWVGVGLSDPSGAAGDSLGRQLEGAFTWDALPDRLTLETGFALLNAGSFPERTGGDAFRGDSSYLYVALTTRF